MSCEWLPIEIQAALVTGLFGGLTVLAGIYVARNLERRQQVRQKATFIATKMPIAGRLLSAGSTLKVSDWEQGALARTLVDELLMALRDIDTTCRRGTRRKQKIGEAARDLMALFSAAQIIYFSGTALSTKETIFRLSSTTANLTRSVFGKPLILEDQINAYVESGLKPLDDREKH